MNVRLKCKSCFLVSAITLVPLVSVRWTYFLLVCPISITFLDALASLGSMLESDSLID